VDENIASVPLMDVLTAISAAGQVPGATDKQPAVHEDAAAC